MKSVGIIRKMDNLGRFVIPSELRKRFELKKDDALEIFTEGDMIVVRKYDPSCIFCGNASKTFSFGGKLICPKCAQTLTGYTSER